MVSKFKLTAVRKQWCLLYQNLLEILYEHGKKYPKEDYAKEND